MTENDHHVVRLGKNELGRHAFESRMPRRIARMIEKESPRNKCAGLVSALAAALESDERLDVAYLCHESVIQMMLPSPHPTYTIPELQQLIEEAWERGYNAYGAVETGGIKGTRKHIGTAEVEALFLHLGTSCTATAVSSDGAWKELLDAIEAHFATTVDSSTHQGRIHRTRRSTVFLQRPNHSVTVVGIERSKDGTRGLLVFDPASPVALISKSASSNRRLPGLSRLLLSTYRRSEAHLRKFSSFEMLFLVDDI